MAPTSARPGATEGASRQSPRRRRQHDGPRRIEQRRLLGAARLEFARAARRARPRRPAETSPPAACAAAACARAAARTADFVCARRRAGDSRRCRATASTRPACSTSTAAAIAASSPSVRARPGSVNAEVRAADRARDRLGMESAIERILVLAPALGAEREARHAGVRPVVGQRLDQRVARAALRAVDERIAVAAVAGIGELAPRSRRRRRNRAAPTPAARRRRCSAR